MQIDLYESIHGKWEWKYRCIKYVIPKCMFTVSASNRSTSSCCVFALLSASLARNYIQNRQPHASKYTKSRNLEKCARYKCICQKAAQVQDNSKVLSVQGSTRRSVMLISSQICMESDPCLTQCATAWAIMFIFLDQHLRNFCLHQSFYIFLKYFNLDLI